jgi:hypothetical protein
MEAAARPSSSGAGKGKEMKDVAHMSAREEREGPNQKEKHTYAGSPSTHRLDGSAREAVACEEGWANTGGAGPVGLDPREDSNEN